MSTRKNANITKNTIKWILFPGDRVNLATGEQFEVDEVKDGFVITLNKRIIELGDIVSINCEPVTAESPITDFASDWISSKINGSRNLAKATEGKPDETHYAELHAGNVSILADLNQANDENVVAVLKNAGMRLERMGTRGFHDASVNIRELLYHLYERFNVKI